MEQNIDINDNITEKEEVKKNKKVKSENKFSMFKTKILFLFMGLFIGFLSCRYFEYQIKNEISNQAVNDTKKVDIEYLTHTIRNMSDLISAKLNYVGLVEMETDATSNSFKKFFTSDKFLMKYEAEINAGIDLSKVELIDDDDTIVVKMPRATIKQKKIIPDSIKFYDLKKAWFGSSEKDEVKQAQIKVEEDIEKNIDVENLLMNAETEAKKIIEGMIITITDKNIVFEIETL